jgi:hypothetical protein
MFFFYCKKSFCNLYIWLVIHDSSYCPDFLNNSIYLYISLFCCKHSTYHSFCLLLMIHLVLKIYYKLFLQQIFDFFLQTIFCLLTHSNNSPFHDSWHNQSLLLLSCSSCSCFAKNQYINLIHSWLLLRFSSFSYFLIDFLTR